MLVLSRKPGERIHIGNNITIEVRRVSGHRVILALDAPHEVRILRGELQTAALEFEVPVEEEEAVAGKTTELKPYRVTHETIPASNSLPTPNAAGNFAI